MLVEAELTAFRIKWLTGVGSNEPCPKLLKIGDKSFCQRTFLFVDDYRREVCYDCFEYDYCIHGMDYLQELIRFGVQSLEDILSLSKKEFCSPRSIDESLVTKWKNMLTNIKPNEREFLKKLLERMIKTLF
ncbi:hypothetical protein [Candidatus Borrarchaeum sp.]|uniref:hypothetical protein n=1 Tax=Candidatus Borrarchaeum sp. TaxID=2846742 RepID=UPI00257E5E90|nr:hypothetical protein [Candidatus Borrarchaeum sp.]